MFRDPLQKRLGEMEIKCPSPSLENVQPSLRERLESLKRYFSRVVEQVPQEYPRFLAEGWKEDWENYHPYLSRSACAYRAIEIAERRGLPERIVKGLQENLYAVLIDGGDKRFDSLGACIRSAIEVAQKYGLGDKAVRNAERRLYAVLIDGGDKRFDSLGACIRSAIEVAQKYGLGDKAVRNAERRLSSL